MSGGNNRKSTYKGMKISNGKSSSLSVKTFFLFLCIAVGFHALFLFLFRPLVSNREAGNSGRGFTLIVTQENIKAVSSTYGLEYWLKHTQSPGELKTRQEAGFTAKLMQSRKNTPLATANLLKDLSTFRSDSLMPDEKNIPPEKRVSLAVPPAKHLAVEDKLFSEKTFRTPSREEKIFPRWQFSTGKTFHGWFDPGKKYNEAEKLLVQYKGQVENSTLCRIDFPFDDLPPVFELLRSCGVSALDELARRELLAFYSTENSGTHGKKSLLCTVLWGEDLLYRNATDHFTNQNTKIKSRRIPGK